MKIDPLLLFADVNDKVISICSRLFPHVEVASESGNDYGYIVRVFDGARGSCLSVF